MANTAPNNSPATVDWVNLQIMEVEKSVTANTQAAVDKVTTSTKQSLDSAKDSFVSKYAFGLVIAGFSTAIACGAGVIGWLWRWIGTLHGFW